MSPSITYKISEAVTGATGGRLVSLDELTAVHSFYSDALSVLIGLVGIFLVLFTVASVGAFRYSKTELKDVIEQQVQARIASLQKEIELSRLNASAEGMTVLALQIRELARYDDRAMGGAMQEVEWLKDPQSYSLEHRLYVKHQQVLMHIEEWKESRHHYVRAAATLCIAVKDYLLAENYSAALTNLKVVALKVGKLPTEREVSEFENEVKVSPKLSGLNHFFFEIRRTTKGTEQEYEFNEVVSQIEDSISKLRGKTDDTFLAQVEAVEQKAKQWVAQYEAKQHD